jgi:UDP-GlcNAc:undecaprenyl-phosphate/decaprenyl-phosphate GlcNAc-1-phosphate transferase
VHFPFNIYLLSFVGAAVASAVSLPVWRRWCRRVGLVDDPGHRKIHAEPIPLAGGLAVFTGVLVPLAGAVAVIMAGLFEAAVSEALSYGLLRRAGQLSAILGGALGMVLLGGLDDRHELTPRTKFAGQLLIALLVAASGIRITLFVESTVFSYFITVLWILTVTNAFNFMDNMNGLCGGLGAIGAFFFAANAAAQGQYLVTMIALLTCGALLGFLPFNFPKATAFLGDAGSHLVGFLLSVLAILPHFYSIEHPRTLAVLNPILILAMPLVDLVWVVILRWRMGRPFYVGDTNHLSHRLVRRGLSQTTAVLLIWACASGIGALTLL